MIAPAVNPQPRNLVFVVCLLAAVFITFGFSFSIGPDLLFRLRPAVLYLHAATAFAWIVLVVVQAGLIRNRKPALHRKIGVWGLWLGAAAAVTSFFTALILRHDSVIRHGADGHVDERIAFLAIPLNGFVIFSVALALAAYYRNRPALHRRFIMLSWAGLIGAAAARIPGLGDVIPAAGKVLPDLPIAVLCVHELLTRRRVHPVYLLGLPLIVAFQLASEYLVNAHPGWWVATARWMIGV
jgi:uncharacterized membrane protein